ncbi:hypothetical protein FSP39_002016 [Pinctada imbricata]|uniref:Methyltransferase type 11 domain-containing protein n=1 Tax=Pinctada imbricata TaxID=66713 RepID=A0AA88XR57_PINIB|nr:hypothetical protein FSP39_002016 [Pinctada imbricata]
MSSAIATLNNRGYQMATPSPLLQDWLSSYDGQHPLLDIGCAYGINTYKALELGIPTVSMDLEKKHLDILLQNMDKEYRHLSTCVIGELPYSIPFSDNYFSGILCAEVIHFLDGKSIETSIDLIYRKLVPNGKFVMTMASDKLLEYIDKDMHTKFQDDLENGIKWPGEMPMDAEFTKKFQNIIENDGIRSEIDHIFGNLLHFCSVEQITEVLQHRGFGILHANVGEHPGYEDPEGLGTVPKRILLVVAQKL